MPTITRRLAFGLLALLWLPVGIAATAPVRGMPWPIEPSAWLSLVVTAALWPAACPGLSQTLADWVSGHGLDRLRRTGPCDCGGVSVRGPARPGGNRDLCSGHQRTSLDAVRILAPYGKNLKYRDLVA